MGDAASISIVGSGPFARRVARAAALAGCAVRLHASEVAELEEAQRAIREEVEAEVAAGRADAAARQTTLDAIVATTDLDEALTHADLVVEATFSPPDRQRALLMRLGESCRASAVVAVASGDPDALLDYVPSPGRLLALRDAGSATPGSPEPGLEVVPGVETSAHALEVARALVRCLARPLTPSTGPTPPRSAPREPA